MDSAQHVSTTSSSSPVIAGGSAARGSVREALPSLDIAARSVLESQAFTGTVASVVAERALDHHWHGLFQYAAIRSGVGAAAGLLARLEEEPEVGQTPSPQAALYRRMRELLAAEPQAPLAPDAPAWWTPADLSLRAGLLALRRALAPR